MLRNAMFNYLPPKFSGKKSYFNEFLQKMSGKLLNSHGRIAIPDAAKIT